MADQCLDIIMDTDEEWAVQIRNLKFESFNQEWLDVVSQPAGGMAAVSQPAVLHMVAVIALGCSVQCATVCAPAPAPVAYTVLTGHVCVVVRSTPAASATGTTTRRRWTTAAATVSCVSCSACCVTARMLAHGLASCLCPVPSRLRYQPLGCSCSCPATGYYNIGDQRLVADFDDLGTNGGTWGPGDEGLQGGYEGNYDGYDEEELRQGYAM